MNIQLTYFEIYSTGDRCYDIPTAKQWLKNHEAFFMVGVLEIGDTKQTSQVIEIENSTVKTRSGSIYTITGIDQKRLHPTRINLETFIVSKYFSVYDITDVPSLIQRGLIVQAEFTDENGNVGTTGPIEKIDLDKREFTTRSEHTYLF